MVNELYYLREIAENTEGGGGGGGRPYDDTELRNRIIALENGKQDSLSAGSRITISSNTINTIDFIVDSINSATTTWSSNKLQSLFNSLAGKIEVSIVAEKPSTPVNSTMYYVGSDAPYDIWFYVNDEYTYFGTTDIDLSDYYTETEVDALLDDKVDKVTGKSLVLDTDIAQITTNKNDIAELKEEKQDKITDSTLSELADATTVSSVSATDKTNKTFALSDLWTYIKGKITEVYYPVGSVVTSLTDTNPSTAYGGTWEKIGEYQEWDIVDWTDINLNSSSSSGLSLDTSTYKDLGTLSVASGHRAKYRVDADGTMHISMRFKHSTTVNYTSSSYANVGVFKYKGTKIVDDCDVWFMGALSGTDKGYSTINVHIKNGAMFFSCTSDNPVTSTANTTQNFIGGSFKLDKSTCDRTYYKYKRTA